MWVWQADKYHNGPFQLTKCIRRKLMCRMGCRSFWSWFDVNHSIFDRDNVQKRFTCIHFRSQWPWPIDLKFVPQLLLSRVASPLNYKFLRLSRFQKITNWKILISCRYLRRNHVFEIWSGSVKGFSVGWGSNFAIPHWLWRSQTTVWACDDVTPLTQAWTIVSSVINKCFRFISPTHDTVIISFTLNCTVHFISLFIILSSRLLIIVQWASSHHTCMTWKCPCKLQRRAGYSSPMISCSQTKPSSAKHGLSVTDKLKCCSNFEQQLIRPRPHSRYRASLSNDEVCHQLHKHICEACTKTIKPIHNSGTLKIDYWMQCSTMMSVATNPRWWTDATSENIVFSPNSTTYCSIFAILSKFAKSRVMMV